MLVQAPGVTEQSKTTSGVSAWAATLQRKEDTARPARAQDFCCIFLDVVGDRRLGVTLFVVLCADRMG